MHWEVIKLRIGIDIDNTLTDINDKLMNAAVEYAKTLNKYVENEDLNINDAYNDGNVYQKLFHFTYNELKYFLGTIQEKITNNATPRNHCVEVIKKLRDEGNEIYIITARDSEFHDNPYMQSEVWLKKNDIYYDKLIVNARNKKRVCLENDIDLLIDDSICNCSNVSSSGILAFTIGNSKKLNNKIKNFDNWQQIYDYINKNALVKIITYDDKYSDEVCYFINESMYKFIGRKYKVRPDISKINDYYIKNNGNFWLAIDIKKKQIIGTIALENRNDNYGILKRFYVDEKYQNIGVGTRLYENLIEYIKSNTKINKIYLACGQILKNAHTFYKNKGFVQMNNIDIDMHYSEDDDFFVKYIDR